MSRTSVPRYECCEAGIVAMELRWTAVASPNPMANILDAVRFDGCGGVDGPLLLKGRLSAPASLAT